MKTSQLRGHAEQLGFCPQEAVRWLSPGELWRTAVKVMLSSIFASYSDKREIQAGLPATLLEWPPGVAALDGDRQPELWLDFVADTGDGFDATFTVASLLARDKLEVGGCDDAIDTTHVLPRASLLVMGGDEVYPTASARAYEDRMQGPYRAALPYADNPPRILALPGNHDWYDGLTAFLRIFTQGHFVGAWCTAQTRSYFAVQLPHRWWLLGLDSQLGAYIDDPQMRFFQEYVSTRLRPGDGVIVCTANPTWVHTGSGDVDAFDAVHYFDRHVVRSRLDPQTGKTVETGASIRLLISGDSHHYARYQEDRAPGDGTAAGDGTAPRQLVTCGLGGAYLSGTHTLPQNLELPPPAARMRNKDLPVRFSLRRRYPDARLSRRLSWGLLKPGRQSLPLRNPGFWPLAGGVHAVLFLALSFLLGLVHARRPILAVRTVGPGAVLAFGGWLLVALAVGAAAWLLVTALRGHPRRPGSTLVGVALQLCVAVGGVTAAAALPWPGRWPDWALLVCCLAGTAILTGLVASFAFAAYIRLARTGLVAGWQMSAQSIEDHKGFVRMHIDGQGNLVLYPMVVERACRDWAIVRDEASGDERPVPAGELPRPKLIERPVVIARGS
jgi:hypothetical protein